MMITTVLQSCACHAMCLRAKSYMMRWSVIGCAFILSSCGASYQSMYESEVQFEHCYRLDEDPHVSQQQQLQCWNKWSFEHARRQTRDRVEYALRRRRQLSFNRPDHPQPESTTAEQDDLVTPVQAPIPYSALSAPPSLQIPPSSPSSQEQSSTAFHAEPATQMCLSACRHGLHRCLDTCNNLKSTSCPNTCNQTHEACSTLCTST